jgi:hypothetical protein
MVNFVGVQVFCCGLMMVFRILLRSQPAGKAAAGFVVAGRGFA